MILARYILREHLAPFFYALFVITFLFLIDYIIRILSSILSKGLGWKVVAEIIVLNMAWMLALSIPMAVLVATLMAFGRLSSDNEVTGMKALGISPLKAIFPVFLVGILLGGSLVYFNNRILPEANHRAAALRTDIGRKKPSALITPRTLIRDFENYQIWIDRLDPVTGSLFGVKIYMAEPGKPLRYTYADSAVMEYANAGSTILIHLKKGQNHILDHKDTRNFVRVDFRSQTISIDNVDASLNRHERSYRSDREMAVGEMLEVVESGRSRIRELNREYQGKVFDEMNALAIVLPPDSAAEALPRLVSQPFWGETPVSPLVLAQVKKQEEEKIYALERFKHRLENERREVSKFLVEVHKKFSIPVACLVFVFIGAPLGIMARKGGIGTATVYSLVFFLIYWVGLFRGEAMADRLQVEPWLAMWGSNIVVGFIGLLLVLRMLRESYLDTVSLPRRLLGLLSPRRARASAARPSAGAPRSLSEPGNPA